MGRAKKSVSRKAVLAEIQEEVTHESWREGGWYPDSQLKWHDDRVFETEEDAQRFLERYEGKYDDHAVLFRNTDRIALKNRKQSERLPESEMSGREAQKQPPAPQESEALCVLEHGRLTRHQTSHGASFILPGQVRRL